MSCSRCPTCEANILPSDWNLHQKTLHYREASGVHCCPDCRFSSQILANSFCHALIEGHELPNLSSRVLPAIIPLPTGPQRIPLPRPSLPHSQPEIYSSVSQTSSPLLPNTSIPDEFLAAQSFAVATRPPSQNEHLKAKNEAETRDDDTIIIEDGTPSFDSIMEAKPNTPRSPEPSQTGKHTPCPVFLEGHELAKLSSRCQVSQSQTDDVQPSLKTSTTQLAVTSTPQQHAPLLDISMNERNIEPEQIDGDCRSQITYAVQETPSSPEPSQPRNPLEVDVIANAECLVLLREERRDRTDRSPTESQENTAKLCGPVSPDIPAVEIFENDGPNISVIQNKTIDYENPTISVDDSDEHFSNNASIDSDDLNPRNDNSMSDRSANPVSETAKCTKCGENVVFGSHSFLIRHALSCNNICLFNCKICKGSWPTADLAERHLNYCRAKCIDKPDFTVYKRESLQGLKKCFSNIDLQSALKTESVTKSVSGLQPNTMPWTESSQQSEDMRSGVTRVLAPSINSATSRKNEPISKLNMKQKNMTLDCQHCFKAVKLRDLTSALRHVIVCMNIKPFRCNGCHREFGDKINAQTHMLRCLGAELELVDEETKDEDVCFGLQVCFPNYDHKWQGFSGSAQRGAYSDSRSSKKEKKCARCSAVVSSQNQPMQHVIHCLNLRPFVCTACGHRGTRKQYAIDHVTSCVAGAEIQMDQEEAVRSGMALCFPNNAPKSEKAGTSGMCAFQCARCWAVTRGHKPIQHLMSCLRIRPYACTSCDFRSTRKVYAEAHTERCDDGASVIVVDRAENEAAVETGIKECYPHQNVNFYGFQL